MHIENRTRTLLRKTKEAHASERVNSPALSSKNEKIELDTIPVINFTGEKWEAVITYESGENIPDLLSNVMEEFYSGPKVITRDDCWTLEGESEDGLSYRLSHLYPPTNVTEVSGGSSTFVMPFHQIDFFQKPLPEELLAQLERLFKHTQEDEEIDILEDPNLADEKDEENVSKKAASKHAPKAEIVAILPGIELQMKNAGTQSIFEHPFHGKTTEGKWKLFLFETNQFQASLETVEDDLEIHLRFKEDALPGISDDELSVIGRGVVQAVSFIHGCHPWPSFWHCSRDGKIVEKWVRPYKKLNSGAGLPMSKARLMQDSSIEKLVIQASAFFANGSEMSRYMKEALYFFRQSDKPETAYEIRLLAQCSLLEGLIGDLWKEKVAPAEPPLFRRIKALAIRAVESNIRDTRREESNGYLRKLRGYLKNWSYWQMREKWQHTCEALDLPWDHFENVFQDWNHYRHPLAHGFKKKSRREGISDQHIAYSRFAGAINILIARAMNFDGNIEKSFLEGYEVISLQESNSTNKS